MKINTYAAILVVVTIIINLQSIVAQTSYSTNRNPVGLEYNLLFNAEDVYQVSQSGSAQYASEAGLFDGNLNVQYTTIAPTVSDPYVVLIEGLPNKHIQAGAWIGWTTRYWYSKRFKIEGYNSYGPAGVGWKTLVDYSDTDYAAYDFMEEVNPGGAYTKLRFTFYEATGRDGRLGISELIFLHPEATSPYKNLIGSNSPWETTENNGITYAGNVGIGNDAPSSKLEIRAQPVLSESFIKLKTSDSQDKDFFEIKNSTGAAGQFIPSVTGQHTSDNRQALYLSAYINEDNDLGEKPLMTFDSRINGSPVVNRPLFSWDSFGNTKMTLTANGNLGIGTSTPEGPLEIRQKSDPNVDRGLVISEVGNSEKVYLHLANNSAGQYGYFHLGGNSNLRGNGQPSSLDGALGLGTIETGTHKLAVEGSIGAREIKVEGSGWSDFVFEENYKLPTLKEVEKHIKVNGHLQDIPSATDVAENGIFLGEMDSKLLQKIEELMLYTIEQNKQIEVLQEKITFLEKKVNEN